MSKKLILVLMIGTVLMAIPMLYLSAKKNVRYWRTVILSMLLTLTGTIGTALMFYVENGRIGGISFYGAVFFVPVCFLLIAPILGIPYRKAMDLSAVGECVMLALMKVNCMSAGCCMGRVMFTTAAGNPIRFPSQIVEMIAAVIIFIFLMKYSKNDKYNGCLYGYYLTFYGVSRFVLNLFRSDTSIFALGLPAGNVWSILATVIGVLWLIGMKNRAVPTEKIDSVAHTE